MHLISCFSRHTRPSSSTEPQRSTRSNASRQTKNPQFMRFFCLRSGDSRIFEQIFVLTNDMLSVYPLVYPCTRITVCAACGLPRKALGWVFYPWYITFWWFRCGIRWIRCWPIGQRSPCTRMCDNGRNNLHVPADRIPPDWTAISVFLFQHNNLKVLFKEWRETFSYPSQQLRL